MAETTTIVCHKDAFRQILVYRNNETDTDTRFGKNGTRYDSKTRSDGARVHALPFDLPRDATGHPVYTGSQEVDGNIRTLTAGNFYQRITYLRMYIRCDEHVT